MSDKSIKFGDKKVNKSNFYNNIKAFEINSIDVNKIKVSPKKLCNNENNSCKYFIRYDENDVIRPILIELPQMIGYGKHFKPDRRMSFKADMGMSFKADDKKLFKRYTEIWEEIHNLLGRESDSKTYYDDGENGRRYFNSKIKISNGEIGTNLHQNKK